MLNSLISTLKDDINYDFLCKKLSYEELQFAETLLSKHKEGFCRCAGHGNCIMSDYICGISSPSVFVRYIHKAFKKVDDGNKVVCPECGRPVYLGNHINGFRGAVICPCGQWFDSNGNPMVFRSDYYIGDHASEES